jgi:hypothetical protein
VTKKKNDFIPLTPEQGQVHQQLGRGGGNQVRVSMVNIFSPFFTTYLAQFEYKGTKMTPFVSTSQVCLLDILVDLSSITKISDISYIKQF